MKKIWLALFALNVSSLMAQPQTTHLASSFAQLPETKKTPVTDTYYGLQVIDNYRWLEDMTRADVQSWFKAQHDYTSGVLDRIPGRDSLIDEFKKLDALNPATISGLVRKNNRYFYKKTLPGENVGKLFYRDGENGKDILLYDPVASNNGKTSSITYFVPSEDGKKMALGIAEGGAEVSTMYAMYVDTKTLYPEKIFPSWFGVSGWSPDNKGFIYSLQPTADNKSMEMLENFQAMYHLVGTDPKNDKDLLSRKKYPSLGFAPEDICFVYYSDDFKYIIAETGGVGHDRNCFYAQASELMKPSIEWKRLFKKADEVTDFSITGNDVYMLTHLSAPGYKITKSSLDDFNPANATVIVPESEYRIEEMAKTKDYLLINYSDGINSTIKQYNIHTREIATLPLPESGSASLTAYDKKTNDCRIDLTSWKRPITLFDYNADDKKLTESTFNSKASFPGVEDIVVEEKEVPAYDGTLVPLSIMYNKRVKKDGSANCILTGYGAYGISITPVFRLTNLALLNRGIIIAYAHVRGGGEKGEDWYKAGFQTTKPNTWKDFIACAEWLEKNNYTTAEKLTGTGSSAGGILIGRAITERPDVFGAAISNVSCSNALRFENTPNGPNNSKEFGTVKDSVQCMALYEMDAFLHVKQGIKYPAVICVAGMNDPRVIPWQPGKFAAALQDATASGKPVMLSVNYDNGHFTEDKSVTYRNYANFFAFALWQTGNPGFQIK